MKTLSVKHNLTPEELRKALTALAEASGITDQVVEALQKSKAVDDTPKVPREPAMRELFERFQGEYSKAIAWIAEQVMEIVAGDMEKAAGTLPRPLTTEEIRRILQAIRDRFAFVSAQMQSDYTPTAELLDRWKAEGLIGKDVTAESFALAAGPEMQLIRNAFVFGRLHLALEQGKNYADIMRLALTLPLQAPDLMAIAVAEQQAAVYITAMGEHLATEAGRLMAARNRAIIQEMVIGYHKQTLTARVLDVEEKREQGIPIPQRQVDSWRGFSSELYHTMADKARDWDRVAFYELYDAKNQGKGIELLGKFGGDQLVYKKPLPTACPQCRHVYLLADGETPRIFRLADLIGNGTNIGRKAHPVKGGEVSGEPRTDGAETMKAVAGLVHPWCQCLGPNPVTGYEPWLTEKQKKIVAAVAARD